ncbi:trehalose-phosphatase [Puccinia triticina 1-1 BBBD Race 1]|uniref:Trehalose-phosphatase n=2 Tax=Puccinia triticina TaxID=208348 RepID=A0A180GGY9_PUCT1|nr:uncharacterized protein PtA15_8A79 [Puccinia triticina]OAV91844.1 trehalose-phosphatase [Puccinia triticina 1-1 BBBD Race 1]WAQ87178.1 hypothetical protein PtA15_8A79 [Puccinia triticina]
MSAMYRLILAVLTLVNLSPATFANLGRDLYIGDKDLFGDRLYYPYRDMSKHFSDEDTHTVHGALPLNPGDIHPPAPGKKRLIVLDNDGVLVQRNGPTAEQAATLLRALIANPNNEVWVNTARGLAGVDSYLNIPGLNIAAEHGTILRVWRPNTEGQGGEHEILGAYHPQGPSMRDAMKGIELEYEHIGMEVFDGPHNLAAYRYEAPYQTTNAHVKARVQGMLRENQFKEFELRLEDGRRYGEVKPKRADKGNLLYMLARKKRYDRGFIMGDQPADEGMFRAVIPVNGNNKFFHTVIVSDEPSQATSAQYKLRNPWEVHNFLEELSRKP